MYWKKQDFIFLWFVRKKISKKYKKHQMTPLNSDSMEAEKYFLKFRGSSVYNFRPWLFSRFYKKLSSINGFSLIFTYFPVKPTKFGFLCILYIFLDAKWTIRNFVDWTKLPVKSRKKSNESLIHFSEISYELLISFY